MAKKDKKDKGVPDEAPVDFAARVGGRGAPEPVAPTPPPAPPPPAPAQPQAPTSRHDGPLPPRRTDARPQMIGMDEALAPPPPVVPAVEEATDAPKSGAIPSPRTLPGPGEMDLVVTPIPTLDDWHRFELALRKLRGVGQVRTEYYRNGALKLRVSYEGPQRLAQALRAGIPGYRVRVLGEDRSTIQLSVSSDNDERRPG